MTQSGPPILSRRALIAAGQPFALDGLDLLAREGQAEQVAAQLTRHDALGAHADIEFGIDPDDLTNPWHAAWASMISFTLGAILPLVTIMLFSPSLRAVVTVLAVALALAATGLASARMGGAHVRPAVVRNVFGGVLAMAITYGIGRLAGVGMA